MQHTQAVNIFRAPQFSQFSIHFLKVHIKETSEFPKVNKKMLGLPKTEK